MSINESQNELPDAKQERDEEALLHDKLNLPSPSYSQGILRRLAGFFSRSKNPTQLVAAESATSNVDMMDAANVSLPSEQPLEAPAPTVIPDQPAEAVIPAQTSIKETEETVSPEVLNYDLDEVNKPESASETISPGEAANRIYD